MTKQREVVIGTGTPERLGREFIDAWKRAERGEAVETTEAIYFTDVTMLTQVISEKRLQLLRELQRHPHTSVYELARRLGRNYKNVHSDVALLKRIGLIEDSDGLSVPYTKIHAEIDLLPA
mgnify:CR=1 FL=1|jgi:predicted transcriptional regulator